MKCRHISDPGLSLDEAELCAADFPEEMLAHVGLPLWLLESPCRGVRLVRFCMMQRRANSDGRWEKRFGRERMKPTMTCFADGLGSHVDLSAGLSDHVSMERPDWFEDTKHFDCADEHRLFSDGVFRLHNAEHLLDVEFTLWDTPHKFSIWADGNGIGGGPSAEAAGYPREAEGFGCASGDGRRAAYEV